MNDFFTTLENSMRFFTLLLTCVIMPTAGCTLNIEFL
jgi:hypothetical protein